MRFALIGAAGFIAPRHLDAIQSIGGELVAAVDPHDSVGILDRYFPQCAFFTDFDRFDRYCDKLMSTPGHIQYVSICSPNYLHDAHCRFALRIGANAICEKPLVVNTHNLDALKILEGESCGHIYNVLQLRYHPETKRAMRLTYTRRETVMVEYVVPRGHWYSYSWKGNPAMSGGLATNIGVHIFDLLFILFGHAKHLVVEYATDREMYGTLNLDLADVNWRLSIHTNETARRMLIINNEVFDFSNGFENLHREVYRDAIRNTGFGIEDARPAIKLTQEMRILAEAL